MKAFEKYPRGIISFKLEEAGKFAFQAAGALLIFY